MQEVFNKYINYLSTERNVSPYTVRNYTHDLLDFFGYLIFREITTLNEVNKQTLRSYLSYLVKRGVAKVSISRKLSAIRSFYRYLLREKLVTTSPVAQTSSPKLDKRLPDFLTSEEMEWLLEATDLTTPQGLRDRALMELLYASGLRVSELEVLI